uniref:Gamma-tubulin complex component n=1 Tax=Heterorhabditis bacteriophora TaxID=37862 RepID=A0A1I7XJS3_HETBA
MSSSIDRKIDATDRLIDAFDCRDADHNSSANGITTPLLHRSSSNVNGSSFSRDLLNTGTQATSVRNPLFETEWVYCDVTPSGSASNASSASRVTAIYRHEPPAYSDLPLRARLGSVPSVPEYVLCSELTGAMQGLEGSYFRSDSFGHMVIASTCALSHTQHNVVESFLSITNQFLDITHSRSQGKDMIVQAFLAATSCFIDEFILDLADIKIHGRQLSLLEMSWPIEAWRDRIVALRRLFALRNESGMNLLKKLYSLHCSICENDPVISSILDSCVGVFCRILKEWLTTGTLNSDEPWMIGSCSDGEFRLIHVPPFLTPWMAEYILKIGKSWQLANKDPETLDKLRSMVETEITPKTLYRQDFRTKLGIVLCEMCNVVCGSVVRSLMKEYHLIEHLAAVRTFLLVEDSHFSMALYNRFCEYTHGLRTKLSQRDASSILVWAITQSPARNRFPFQINIDTLSTTSDSPNTSSRMQFVAPLRPFYRAEGVVAQVFSGMEQRYEILFRFIWSIDMTRFSISDVIFEINPMFREWPSKY